MRNQQPEIRTIQQAQAWLATCVDAWGSDSGIPIDFAFEHWLTDSRQALFEFTRRDAAQRLKYPYEDDLDFRAWKGTFSDTSLGFGGMAGQAISSAPMFAYSDGRKIAVYVGSRYAYTVEIAKCKTEGRFLSNALYEAFRLYQLPGRSEIRRMFPGTVVDS